MSRKLMCLMWCIIVFSACYVIIAMMANFGGEGGKFIYMNKLDAFYRDIGMRGLDRDLLIRQSFHVQSSFEEMLAGDNVNVNDVNKDTEDAMVPDAEMLNDGKSEKHMNDNAKLNSTEKHQNSLDKLVADRRLKAKYYKLKATRVNPFDFKFMEAGESICDKNEKQYLVILCLTKYYDIETREAIRKTWGSIAKERRWPGVPGVIPAVKLVFLLGSHEDSLVKRTIIEDEKQRFGDIVAADFKDSYTNLTLKVMMGLKWVSNYCPSVRFVVKIDQDTFLHVLNLLNFLHFLPIPKEGIIIGYQNNAPKVLRTGRWGVDRNTFPMSTYPNYTNGNCYVISGNLVPNLLEAAEKMPYIWVEDAFLTGIVRTVLGVNIYHHKGFTRWNDKPPRLCGFHNRVRIAATNTDNERKRNLWKALNYVNLRNCYDVETHLER